MRRAASILLLGAAAAASTASSEEPPNATYDIAERSADIDPSRDRIVVSLDAAWGPDARRNAQITFCSIHFWVESDEDPQSRDLTVRAESGDGDIVEGPVNDGLFGESGWEADIPGASTEDHCDATVEITFSGPDREEGYPVRFGGFGFVRFPSARDAEDLRGSISLSGP